MDSFRFFRRPRETGDCAHAAGRRPVRSAVAAEKAVILPLFASVLKKMQDISRRGLAKFGTNQ
ncbi:hypothetical protein CLOSTASPAR_02637 [[Clostridium] asparagiforme DSM 15981]|uniref:Uncharacterized protein n=1 Tax=[Clostridium] asparagiforme DSM 15981 TaxID=518636 RepID=C0D056_9FIRM|nr:hypothetical protein CLOSTASPAR_02637 [[Clostridium] asparagiforme DSM 15981]